METLISVVIATTNRKDDLAKCLRSLFLQSYGNLQIIVVDNGGKIPLTFWMKKNFPKVKLIRSDKNLGAAGGRNLGIRYAKGNYILFMDDDAQAHKDMVGELYKELVKDKEAGIVHPKIYDFEKRNVLQGLGCDINLLTGRVSAVGIREVDTGQYDKVQEIQTVGCIWMVKREVIERIGNYDETFFIPYEDTDFSIRAKRAGFKILFIPTALAWHRGVKDTYINKWIDYIGIRSADRAYRISRNKIIFMRKNATVKNFLIFFLIFNPVYIVIHSLIIILGGRVDIFSKYWKGVLSGIWYTFKYNNPLFELEYILMAWTDSICLVIQKKAKSILDVGCGLGMPLRLIKYRMKVDYAVGVDLFQPYLDVLKEERLHDKYLLADVRKMKVSPKSFDVVFASDVLEHMSKKDAWKLLGDMEKIAKKQVIVTTSLGYFYHPPVDGNPLQLHKSGYKPEEFEQRGYKTFKYGRKEILGTEGLVHRIKFDPLKKLIFLFNFALFPFYLIFPDLGNYCFVVYKNIK